MLQIHEKIKRARIEANLSEEELAKKIGVKRSTYQYWETVTPSVQKIKRVASALGKHEDYFFSDDENFGNPSQKASDELPIGNLKVTLEDYVNEIKRQRDYLEKVISDKGDKIISLLSEKIKQKDIKTGNHH